MTDTTGTSTPTPFRAIRQSVPKLSVREVARRVDARGKVEMNSGRLSVIERGLVPSDEERSEIMAVLMEALER